jgi:hypothetical protein
MEKLDKNLFRNNEEKRPHSIESLLEKCPTEIVELLKQKKYYHVTLDSLASSVLEKGLRNDSQIIEQSDLEFFEDIYKKYSKRRNDSFLEGYIKGKDKRTEDGRRGIYLSVLPDLMYQIPEKLKFFLANLHFFIESGRATPEEVTQAKDIFDKYYLKVANDKVAVLEVSAMSPVILEYIFSGYEDEDLNDPDVMDGLKFRIRMYEPNLEVLKSIEPEYIAKTKEHVMSIEELERGVKNSGFIIF